MCITVFNHDNHMHYSTKSCSTGPVCIGVQTVLEVVVFSSMFYLNWNFPIHTPTIITLARKAWELR